MTELQEKVLGLLKDIDKLCREYDIDYYLTAGTLIGAMRHKGFIPWDDDADIIMTRDNWEKFLKCTRDKLPNGITLNSQYDDPNLAMSANHYVDTNTTAIYRYDITNPEKAGIMIDVIIMDPVPDNEEAKQIYVNALTQYTELTTLPYQYSLRIGRSTQFERNWNKKNTIGMRKTLDEITKIAFHYTEEESQLYAQRFAGSPHFWPKEQFGTPIYVPFEDTMLPVPQRAGDCLCIGYDDDWMFVPQGGVAKSTHEFCVRSMTIPSGYILDDFESRVDRKELEQYYVKRKKIQVAQTDNKFKAAMDSYRFVAERVRLLYEKKIAENDYAELLARRDFDALEEYFAEYIKYQCSNHYVGSSALEGWINWYRKCYPYLIDIGDEALHAVLELLMYKQKLSRVSKLLKARKAISRPLSIELENMDKLYQAVKSATSAYECEENTKCREILDEYLPYYPNNPYLFKLELKLQIREGILPQELMKKAKNGLQLFKNDPELIYLVAFACLKMNNKNATIKLFQKLSKTTNHGFVLLHMREQTEALIEEEPYRKELYNLLLDIRSAMGEEELPKLNDILPHPPVSVIEESSLEYTTDTIQYNVEAIASQSEFDDFIESIINSESVNITPTAQFTDIQHKRFELLCELKQICTDNGIRYYLFGKGLLQAVRHKKYIDTNGELVVAMTAENCSKFIDAVKAQKRNDRFLDSMAENPRFHRFCVRYGNKETLDFFTSQCGTANCGIFITIEILRFPAKNKFRNLMDQMLEAGWETRNTMKWTSARRKISYFTVSALCKIFGERNIGKWMFNHLFKGPKKKVTGKYYLKPFWGERTYYAAFWFKYVRSVKLEGQAFTTMKPYELYLKTAYGAKWKTRTYPMTKLNNFSRIVDASIDSREYLTFLKQNNIDTDKVWKHRQMTDRKYAPVVTMGAETSKHWDIMVMCGERWRLLEKYEPMKLYIMELFRENRIARLMEILKDYYDTAMQFTKKGMGICFDKKIFEILEYCLRLKGKGKDAAAIRKLIRKEDWAPIYLDERYKENKMREATKHDIPAILMYLKRHINDCVYMYIDISKYGLDNPNMRVWVDSNNNGVKMVVMKYHTSISVYTDVKNWDVSGVAELIRSEGVLSVTGKKELVEQLYEVCADMYNVSYGSVFNFTNYRIDTVDAEIETATTADTLEIAKLITTDDGIGSYYEVENLAQQLAERIETGMGRSYVIRNDEGNIIAHIASYAEYDHIATTGGLIVSSECRNGVMGSVMEGYLVRQLLKENYKIYTFVTERLRKKLLTAMGNICVGEYGKMTMKSENKE